MLSYLNTAFLLKVSQWSSGDGKKVVSQFTCGLFSLNRFSILCLVFHFQKMNIQLKSSLTIIITKYSFIEFSLETTCFAVCHGRSHLSPASTCLCHSLKA